VVGGRITKKLLIYELTVVLSLIMIVILKEMAVYDAGKGNKLVDSPYLMIISFFFLYGFL